MLLGLQFRLSKLIVPSDARIGYTLSNFSTKLVPFSNVFAVTPVPAAPTSENSPLRVLKAFLTNLPPINVVTGTHPRELGMAVPTN